MKVVKSPGAVAATGLLKQTSLVDTSLQKIAFPPKNDASDF